MRISYRVRSSRASTRLLPIVAAIALLTAACGGGDAAAPAPAPAPAPAAPADTEPAPQELRTVNIVVSNYPVLHYATPFLVGIENGLFEAEGVVIGEITGGAGGGAVLRNVLAGDIGFALVAASAVVQGYLAGAPVVAIGGGIETVNELEFMTSPLLTGVNTFEDLRNLGRPVKCGFSNPGAVTEALCYGLANYLGLSIPDQFETIAAGGVGEGIPLLIDGTLDIFPIPEPLPTLRGAGLGPSLGPAGLFMPNLQQLVAVTSPRFLEEHPDVLEAIMRGLINSIDVLYADIDGAIALYAANAEIDEQAVRNTLALVTAGNDYNMGIKAESLEVFDVIIEQSAGIRNVPWSDVFDTRIMRALGLDYPAFLDD